MGHARIGRIRMKSGGAEVRVLRNEPRDPGNRGPENWQGEVIKSARSIASFSEAGSELCGFVVLGLYSDGGSSLGWRYDGKRSPIPPSMLPAYVAELIRRDLLTQSVAVEVYNRNGED